jgi:hypothetical protein
MRGRQCWLVLIAAAVSLVLLHSFTLASDDAKAGTTLRGLKSVYVQVENFDPEIQQALKKGGLTENSLQMTIEGKLEAAGIRVLSEEEFRKLEHSSLLCVNLRMLMPEAFQRVTFTLEGIPISKPEQGQRYFYAIDVEFRQIVSLVRDASIKALATTWSIGSVGFCRPARIRADVMDQVNGFVDAYTATNPK